MRKPVSSSPQKGFSLLEVLLAVTIAISLGSMQLGKIKRESESIQAKAVGEQLRMVGGALNDYVVLHYSQISDMTTVAAPGTADDPGPRTCDSATGICTITSDTLRRNGLLPASFSGRNAFGATYEYYIRVTGTSPNWQVDGIVVTSDPYSIGGLPRFDLIGQAMNEAGADSGTTRTTATRVDGYNGAWQETGYPISQVGLLGYRVGYGTSGFVSFLRVDGANYMTGDLRLGDASDMATFRNISNTRNITAIGNIQGAKVVATSPTSDAITIRTSNVANPNNYIGSSGTQGQRLSLRAAQGIEVVNAGGTARADLSAGNSNFLDVQANDLSVSDITATSLTSSGNVTGANMTASGNVTATGNFQTTNGNLITTNGDISALNGTVSASSLVAGNSTFTTNDWSMGTGANAGGWFMTDTTWMRVKNDKNIYTAGEIRGGQIFSTGNVTANNYLQITGAAAAGGGCTPGTDPSGNATGKFSRDATGRLLQCVSGVWRTGSLSSVTTVTSGTCSNGGECVATCPAGRYLTGGGYTVARATISDPSGPDWSRGDAGSNSWRVRSLAGFPGSVFRAEATCAN